MQRVFRLQGKRNMKDIGLRGVGAYLQVEDLNAKVALIQALIPLGLQAVQDLRAEEVTQLARPRYARTGGQPGLVGWSQQGGSVNLADQKLPLPVPRVRNLPRNTEVPLTTYQRLRERRQADLSFFRKLLLELSCRDYAACAEAVPDAFGLSPSSVSRRVLRVSAQQFRALQARRLDPFDLVALLLDGKTFAEDASPLCQYG